MREDVRSNIKKNIILIIGKIIIMLGGIFLIKEFLISEKYMNSPVEYVEELGQNVYSTYIGVHWTTMLGILGCIMLVVGMITLVKTKYCKTVPLALVLSLININCWTVFFWGSDGMYSYLEYNTDFLNSIHNVLQILSKGCFQILLIGIIIYEIYKKKYIKVFVTILSMLLMCVSFGDLYLSTISNRWFLYQIILMVFPIVVIFYGNAMTDFRKNK